MSKFPLYFEMKKYSDDCSNLLKSPHRNLYAVSLPSSKNKTGRIRLSFDIAPRHIQMLDKVLSSYGEKCWQDFFSDFMSDLLIRGWMPWGLLIFRQGQAIVNELKKHPHDEKDYLIGSFALLNGEKDNRLVSFIPINYKHTLKDLATVSPVLNEAWHLMKDAHKDKHWIAIL